MSVERKLDLLGYGYFLFLFLLPPLLILLPVWVFRWRSRFLRFCLATLVPWLGIQAYHSMFIQPLSFHLARERGDRLYDGVGASAAIFLMGLVIPVLIALLTLAAEYLLHRWRSSPDRAFPDHTNVTSSETD